MEREPRLEPSQLTGIHLNLEEGAIEFEDRHGTVGRLRFTSETVLYEGRPLLLLPSGDPTNSEEASPPPVPDQPHAPSPALPLFHNPLPRDPRTRF
jgi:hypothetical protein